MKVFRKNILYAALLLALPLLTSSCIYDAADAPETLAAAEGMPRISLNIRSVATGKASAEVTEMIGSLRVVIVSEVTDEETAQTTSYVEYNELFDFAASKEEGGMFSGPGEVASTFRFIITRNTVPGLKKLFLIANEDQVPSIHFQTDGALPSGLQDGMTLTDFLDSYTADLVPGLVYPEAGSRPEEGQPKGAEFENFVNTIYYTPNFVEQTQADYPSNPKPYEIFLPYTSYYEFNLATKEDIESGKSDGAVNILDNTIYLVPCATKFRFQIQNYRPDPVVIKSFKLGGMATDMFLFAQINDSKDLYKNFGDKKGLWWVDWLAYVSAKSLEYGDPEQNLAFSTAYGWMNYYDIPATAIDMDAEGDVMDNAERKGILELVDNPENPWEIPANTSNNFVQGPPGFYYTGYFYLPESRYMVDFPMYDENGNELPPQSLQAYYLKLSMVSGTTSAVKDTQIGNLGSMFRNTNTYITIKLRDALTVGAYAELTPWDETHTNGTVLEESSDEY